MAKFQKKLTSSQVARAVTKIANGATIDSVAREFGVSHRTVYRYLSGWHEKPEKSKCGTNAGYSQHLRKKEIACEECLKAHAFTQKRWINVHNKQSNRI